MFADSFSFDHEDDFIAHVTDVAYQAVLRQGLRHSFLDVQLDLWHEIRSAYHDRIANHDLVEVA